MSDIKNTVNFTLRHAVAPIQLRHVVFYINLIYTKIYNFIG